ncbi:MAG: hypothetical protein RL754_15 [Bacteroidota bacterium]|jgi:aminoglycoside 3-N-acetyltransferase
MRDLIRSLVPKPLLEWNRRRKKRAVRKELAEQRERGAVLTKDQLVAELKVAGVERGRDLLVHSSLSAIGYVDGGPDAVIEALLEVIGPEATLLMPSSPVVTLQAKHELAVFDVDQTPSKMGAITEVFRKNWAQYRSAHPLEPVCAYGPKAQWYTEDHLLDGTSYGKNSPWNRHMERGGQLLYIGTTLINSGTSLHAVEDAIGADSMPMPVYMPESREFEVSFGGKRQTVQSRVHNPEVSATRKCDGLIPLLERRGTLKRVLLGKAECLLVDAGQMKSILLEEYEQHGVTMYTPEGI